MFKAQSELKHESFVLEKKREKAPKYYNINDILAVGYKISSRRAMELKKEKK